MNLKRLLPMLALTGSLASCGNIPVDPKDGEEEEIDESSPTPSNAEEESTTKSNPNTGTFTSAFGACEPAESVIGYVQGPSGLDLRLSYTDATIAGLSVKDSQQVLSTSTSAELSTTIKEKISGPLCFEATDAAGNILEPTCSSAGYIVPQATNIFDNYLFSPTSGIRIYTYLEALTTAGTPHMFIAQSFTPTENITIQSAFTDFFFRDGTSEVQIRTDNAGNPGTMIASTFEYLGRVVGNNDCQRVSYAFQFPKPIQLTAGQRYWLVKHALDIAAVDFLYATNWSLDTSGEKALRSTNGLTWENACVILGGGIPYQAGCSAIYGVY